MATRKEDWPEASPKVKAFPEMQVSTLVVKESVFREGFTFTIHFGPA
jgi:hypothetical protein